MKRYVRYMLLSLAAVVGLTATAVAQRMPERSLVRKGNRQFARERYDLSADSYKQALESAPGNFEATYNLGNTMVRTEQYDKAEQLLTAAAADSLRSDEERAEALQSGQCAVCAEEAQGGSGELPPLSGIESCRHGGQVQLRLHETSSG